MQRLATLPWRGGPEHRIARVGPGGGRGVQLAVSPRSLLIQTPSRWLRPHCCAGSAAAVSCTCRASSGSTSKWDTSGLGKWRRPSATPNGPSFADWAPRRGQSRCCWSNSSPMISGPTSLMQQGRAGRLLAWTQPWCREHGSSVKSRAARRSSGRWSSSSPRGRRTIPAAGPLGTYRPPRRTRQLLESHARWAARARRGSAQRAPSGELSKFIRGIGMRSVRRTLPGTTTGRSSWTRSAGLSRRHRLWLSTGGSRKRSVGALSTRRAIRRG